MKVYQPTRARRLPCVGSLPRISVQNAGGYWAMSAVVAIAVVALTTVRIGELLGPIRILKPVFVSTLAGVVAHLIQTRPVAWARLWKSLPFRLVVMYAIVVALSFPFSIWKGRTLSTMMVLPWALGLVIVVGLTRPTIRDVDNVFRWTAWFTAITAAVLLVNGDVVAGSRLTSKGSYDPNDLAALFCFAMPIAIGTMFRGRWYSRISSCLSAAVLCVALMETGSRGGLIGLVGGMLVFLLAFQPRTVLLVGVVLSIALPAAWPLVPATMRDRAASLFSLEDDYNSTSNSGRIYLWKRGIVFALQRPLLGIGAGTFEAKIGDDFRVQGSRGSWHTAHNTFVQVAAELGLLGFGLLVWLLALYGKYAAKFWSWKSRVHRPEYLASLVGYVVCIIFLSHGYSYILFGIFGFTVLLSSLSRALLEVQDRSLDQFRYKTSSRGAAINGAR